MFVNYAHRGASSYAPENTFAAFYKGVEMGANGIETDVQRSRDGVLVLHHDEWIAKIFNTIRTIEEFFVFSE
ncbi:MAG: glycerophosphodiester phosphodiesterase [Oscillospiraceae bacterium]|nr:glycerophosphodiester phosphodiesterase [Oscillospiraceae bacterium]